MRLEHVALIAALIALCGACSSPSPSATEREAPSTPSAAGAPARPTDERPEPVAAPEAVRWTDLEIAEGCTVRMAENPSAFDLRLDWKPCENGPPGCRETSTFLGGDLLDGSRYLRGAMHRGNVWLVASFSLAGPILQYAIAPLDGAPFMVVEQPPDAACSVGIGQLSDDGGVVEIAYDNVAGYASRAYLRGPLREDASWSKVAARLLRSEFPRFVGEAELSIGGRVTVAANGGPIRWFDPASAEWSRVPGSKRGWACCFSGHGDYVTFMIESVPERVMVAKLGEPARELRPVVKGGGTSPVSIDGNRALWCEGRGRDVNNYYRSIDLWTGEVTAEIEIENARVVTSLPLDAMTAPRFHDGVAVISLYERGEADRLAVVRVADGETRLLVAPEGLRFERLLWVTGDEIAVMVGPGGNHLGPSTFRRIPIDVLPRMPLAGGEEAK
jgi:hypothetical protein